MPFLFTPCWKSAVDFAQKWASATGVRYQVARCENFWTAEPR